MPSLRTRLRQARALLAVVLNVCVLGIYAPQLASHLDEDLLNLPGRP